QKSMAALMGVGVAAAEARSVGLRIATIVKFRLEMARLRSTLSRMSCIERTIEISFKHRVFFTRDVFGASNALLRDVLNGKDSSVVPRVLVVVDESLNSAQPDLSRKIQTYFEASPNVRLVCPPVILEGGERVKNSYFHV